MASRAVSALLASRHERPHLHRTVVRVGALAAWAATALYLLAAAITRSGDVFVEGIGPLIAATLMTAQIVAGREQGGLALLGSGVVLTVWYTLFGDEGTVVPAAVALVLIASLAMLFVTRHRNLLSFVSALALFAIPLLWDLPLEDGLILGAVMSLGFAMTHFILSSIQKSSSAFNARYQMLFEGSPTAVLEEDWSEAVEYVRSEYTGKPERIRHFLLAYPAVVRRAVGKAKVLRANEAALELLEIRHPGRFVGYRDPDVVTDETMDAFVSALTCLYEGDKTWEHEGPSRRRSGELQWLQSRSVDTSAGEPASSIVVALADVTHLKARNEAMAEMVRAKDEFIANVSHELRTPLTAVIGLTSEMAANPEMGAEERCELLELVSGQAAEMANIVDDLLVAARAEMGTVTVDVQTMDMLAELRATIEGIGMEIDMPATPPPFVLADPRRVRQILRNLLTNAQRYGGPKRRVTAGALIDRVWLEVRDNGGGISDDEAAHIFEPYVTGNSGVKGSVGLGLAVARQLAELMGGSLQYERSAGESVFRLLLPVATDREPILASQSDQS
ncbi:MAG: HAMP domain-containing sensor histidine kinase [Acidimicrobiia bacterium]